MGIFLGLPIYFCFISILAQVQPENIKITGIERTIEPNAQAELSITIDVKKDKFPFCIFPPEIENKNGGKIDLEVTRVQSKETESLASYSIFINAKAKEEGSYLVGPMKIPYVLLTSEIESMFEKDNTQVVPTYFWEIPEFSIQVGKTMFSKLWFFLLLIIVLILIIISAYYYVFIGKEKKTFTVDSSDLYLSALHEARKYRLDGDYYRFFVTLEQVLTDISEKIDSPELLKLKEKVKEKRIEIGYKGQVISEAEIDFYWREMEKWLDVLKKQKN